MTNPNNAVGTNGAYGGRTSVNALNDVLSSFNGRGIVSGWNCQASSGMTVTLGGVVGSRDVAIAEDNIGNKTTVNNISASPIEVTLPAAPTANNRIDLIVAYVANPPQGSATVVDNPSACGLIVVSSAVAANPTVPTEANIRTAITEDGATGTNAYYVVLASIAVSAGLSTVTDNLITQGSITSTKIDPTTLAAMGGYSTSEVATPFTWIDGKTIYKKTINFGSMPNNTSKSVAHGITGLDNIIDYSAIARRTDGIYFPLPYVSSSSAEEMTIRFDNTNITTISYTDRSSLTLYCTLYYTKTS